MSENSKIEWTDSTWNFLVGCEKVSAGCKNCYAIQTSWIRQHNPKMKDKFEGVVEKTPGGQLNWTGRVNVSESALLIPLKKKKPTKYFVNSLSDLFHENVPFPIIDKAFAVMAIAMQHTFQILTKRPKRMLEYFSRPDLQDCITTAIADMAQNPSADYELTAAASQDLFENGLPLHNVHIGVSCEDQKTADERIPFLLQVPAAVRFLSCEPLLDALDLSEYMILTDTNQSNTELAEKRGWGYDDWSGGFVGPGEKDSIYGARSGIHWIIAGGESGPGARPVHPDWIRSLVSQCNFAEVPFFFKQWGEYAPHMDGPNVKKVSVVHRGTGYEMCKVGKKAAGRLLDGRTWDQFPQPPQ